MSLCSKKKGRIMKLLIDDDYEFEFEFEKEDLICPKCNNLRRIDVDHNHSSLGDFWYDLSLYCEHCSEVEEIHSTI